MQAENPTLSYRLRCGAAQVNDPIPAVLLRKYLAFVRQTVTPRLSSEAAKVLRHSTYPFEIIMVMMILFQLQCVN